MAKNKKFRKLTQVGGFINFEVVGADEEVIKGERFATNLSFVSIWYFSGNDYKRISISQDNIIEFRDKLTEIITFFDLK